MTIPRVSWYGCYDGSWTGNLIPAAFAHPAKAPFALAERIYRHMLAEGWLRPGDRVIDPFGGVGCLAFHALVNGLHYDGVELEPKFHALAQENLALWATRYAGKLPRWGSARVHLGDSRDLAQIVAAAEASVSSPPYSSGTVHGENLGNLPAGDYDGAVASPPYESQVIRKPDIGKPGFMQGATQGQHCFDAYGESDGQLGAQASETFWQAARVIVEQTYSVLKPGAVAAWITGNYKRNGRVVDFGGQWLTLCEHIGFEPLLHAVAWKVNDYGVQMGLLGEERALRKERVSFFRRLSNAKDPATAILNEDVYFVRKPWSA